MDDKDRQLYDMYVQWIWLHAPEVYRDELDQCESVILQGIKWILEAHQCTCNTIHDRNCPRYQIPVVPCGVSTEGAAWAMEQQCTCRVIDGKHDPHCPGGSEYWKQHDH